jgi:hypothetical protein
MTTTPPESRCTTEAIRLQASRHTRVRRDILRPQSIAIIVAEVQVGGIEREHPNQPSRTLEPSQNHGGMVAGRRVTVND